MFNVIYYSIYQIDLRFKESSQFHLKNAGVFCKYISVLFKKILITE